MNKKYLPDEAKRVIEQEPTAGSEYYEITLLGNDDGSINRSITTQFVGYRETKTTLRDITALPLEPNCASLETGFAQKVALMRTDGFA